MRVELSVVIASLESPEALRNCLKSVTKNAESGIEIVVADRCLNGKTAAWKNEFPAIEFLEFPAKTSLAKLLGAGINRASGEILAITDSTCVVSDDWIAAIARAHETTAPVIGGAVEMSANGGESLTDWAAYFCDYGQFMPPGARGVAAAVPGNNFSVKRRILEKGAEFSANEFWKTLWCRRLQAEGIELFFEPSISVSRRKTYKFIPFLVRRFYQGRCFAAMRSAKTPAFKRAFCAAGSILLPILFLFRTISPVVRGKRRVGKLLLSLPIIFTAIVFWSLGEAVGYAAGIGNTRERID